MTISDLPTVAVVYDVGAATPLEILAAASGVCEVLFLYDRGNPDAAVDIDVILELAHGVDITGVRDDALLKLLEPYEPAGVVTFSEFRLGLASELASLLSLRGHDAPTLARLTRKSMQRACLAAESVDGVRFEVVRSAAELLPAIGRMGLPAVLKPSTGTHSRDTFRIDRREDAETLAAELRIREDFILEELLEGHPRWAGDAWGDHLSVEHVSFEGGHRHLVTLGKFPLADPFRERGDFFPATIDEECHARVCELAVAALDAIGVRDGVTHTEIKLTADGPRVIEVNGRLGGGVADIVRKAGGADPIRSALQVAMGKEPVPGPPLATDKVVFELSVLSPADRVTVVAIDGLDEIRALPGVDRVVGVARRGSVVDWRNGSMSQFCTVFGRAADHVSLAGLRERVEQTLIVKYETDGGSETP